MRPWKNVSNKISWNFTPHWAACPSMETVDLFHIVLLQGVVHTKRKLVENPFWPWPKILNLPNKCLICVERFSFQLEEHVTIATWSQFDSLVDFTAPSRPPSRWRFFSQWFKLEPVHNVFSLLELVLDTLKLPFEGVRISTVTIENPIGENKFVSYEHHHHAGLNVVPE